MTVPVPPPIPPPIPPVITPVSPVLFPTYPAPDVIKGGWVRDFVDDFDLPLDTKVWGRYHHGTLPDGKQDHWYRENVYTENGSLVILASKAGDLDWRTGGVCSAPGFWAVGGKWTCRARFERACGIGYAFLLYPKGGAWPPEIDFIEGMCGGARAMGSLHYSPKNLVISNYLLSVDMTKWHTYGVIVTPGVIQYTIDGNVWATQTSLGVPDMPLWIGFQSGANVLTAANTGTVEMIDTTTPVESRIYIDWVAHWSATAL